MTEQSYLPPDQDDWTGMELCEVNDAQPSAKPPSRWGFGISLVLLYFGGIMSLMLAGGEPAIGGVGLVLVLLGITLIIIEFMANRRRADRQFIELAKLYPECAAGEFAKLALYRPQLGVDNRRHRWDVGYLWVEGESLYWYGAWFKLRIRRADLGGAHWETFALCYVLQLPPNTIGDLRRLRIHEAPDGKKRLKLNASPALLNWWNDRKK